MIPIRDVIPSPAPPAVTIALIAVQAAAWCSHALLSGSNADRLPLTSNLWALWIFGDTLEGRLGRLRYLAFYLLCGAVATFAEDALTVTAASPAGTTGPSGAVAGVMGAYVALYPQSRVLTLAPVPMATWDLIEIPAGWLLALWGVLQLLTTGALSGPATSSVPALAAVAGTFLLGAAVGLALRRQRFPEW